MFAALPAVLLLTAAYNILYALASTLLCHAVAACAALLVHFALVFITNNYAVIIIAAYVSTARVWCRWDDRNRAIVGCADCGEDAASTCQKGQD